MISESEKGVLCTVFRIGMNSVRRSGFNQTASARTEGPMLQAGWLPRAHQPCLRASALLPCTYLPRILQGILGHGRDKAAPLNVSLCPQDPLSSPPLFFFPGGDSQLFLSSQVSSGGALPARLWRKQGPRRLEGPGLQGPHAALRAQQEGTFGKHGAFSPTNQTSPYELGAGAEFQSEIHSP